MQLWARKEDLAAVEGKGTPPAGLTGFRPRLTARSEGLKAVEWLSATGALLDWPWTTQPMTDARTRCTGDVCGAAL